MRPCSPYLGEILAGLQGCYNVGVHVQSRAARTVRGPGKSPFAAADDLPTEAYTMVNLSLSYRMKLASSGDALLFLKLDNAGDTLAYNAGTIATVRALAPLPGRRLMAGLRVAI